MCRRCLILCALVCEWGGLCGPQTYAHITFVSLVIAQSTEGAKRGGVNGAVLPVPSSSGGPPSWEGWHFNLTSEPVWSVHPVRSGPGSGSLTLFFAHFPQKHSRKAFACCLQVSATRKTAQAALDLDGIRRRPACGAHQDSRIRPSMGRVE